MWVVFKGHLDERAWFIHNGGIMDLVQNEKNSWARVGGNSIVIRL